MSSNDDTLVNKQCVPCHGGIAALTPAEARKMLGRLLASNDGGWQLVEDGKALRREFKFADFYREHDATSFLSSSMLQGRPPVFTGPISYAGHAMVTRDIANFKAALARVKAEEGFITSVAPGSFARRQNQYYKTDEEFLFALGEAMREEYKAVIDAGPGAPAR